MKGYRRFFLWGFFLVFCSGTIFYTFPAQAGGKSIYRKALKKATRTDELYQNVGLYASISWQATLLSPEYLQAQQNEIARIYRDTAPRESLTLEKSMRAASGRTAFFLSFYAFDRKHADLAMKDTEWQLRLIVGGEEYDAEKIEKLGKPTQLQKWLFPYMNLWSNFYIVTFPPSAGVNRSDVTLSVRGPFGHGTLSW